MDVFHMYYEFAYKLQISTFIACTRWLEEKNRTNQIGK